MIPFIRARKEEDIKEVTLSNAVVEMILPPGAVAAVPVKNVRTATLVVAVDDDVETLLRCFSIRVPGKRRATCVISPGWTIVY